MKFNYIPFFFWFISLIFISMDAVGQDTTISETEEIIKTLPISLNLMEVYTTILDISDENLSKLRITLGKHKLVYDSRGKKLDRPVVSNITNQEESSPRQLNRKARNHVKYSEYDEALEKYSVSPQKDSSQKEA